MSFVRDIFDRLDTDAVLLRELRGDGAVSVSGRELLQRINTARAFLLTKALKKGDRCGLLAHNSVDWIAMDLAIMAEGLIVVPLYARQAPAELVAMMKDCTPALVCCGDFGLRDNIGSSANLRIVSIRTAPALTACWTSRSTNGASPCRSKSIALPTRS